MRIYKRNTVGTPAGADAHGAHDLSYLRPSRTMDNIGAWVILIRKSIRQHLAETYPIRTPVCSNERYATRFDISEGFARNQMPIQTPTWIMLSSVATNPIKSAAGRLMDASGSTYRGPVLRSSADVLRVDDCRDRRAPLRHSQTR